MLDPRESDLKLAYELGRKAIYCGLGMIGLAAVHQQTMEALLRELPRRLAADALAARSAQFLLEAVSPLEMTLRGYAEAIRRLETEVAERRRAEQALRLAHDELELRVAQRTAELSSANERLRRHEEELQRINTELRQANRAKDQFVATVSHELRNPLAAIQGGVHALRLTLPAGSRLDRVIEILQRNTALQIRLVNDLLDLSRLTRDKISLQQTPVGLDTIAAAAVSDQRHDAEQAGITLALHAEPGSWVLGDADRLQQVVLNLLSNAIKFTPAGGRVDVRVLQTDRRVEELGRGVPLAFDSSGEGAEPASCCLIVEDTGIGLDRSLREQVFEAFKQGEIAGRRQPGLGLGLSLVKLITEKLGGRVWADSDGPNLGSSFFIALPALQLEQRLPSPWQGGGQVHLLVVEDNPDTLDLLATGLRSLGYAVSTAGSGEQALSLLPGTRPDLVLADLGLPGMSGLELLRQIRQIDGLQRIPAFAVTCHASPEDVRQVQEAGFTGHFVKPVDLAVLDRRIRSWLEADET